MTDSSRESLVVLDRAVAARVASLSDQRPDWPCRAGCSHCCRSLATPLDVTRAEWQRLEEGLAALPAAARLEVETRMRDAAHVAQKPHVCPFLDLDDGVCRVYAHRPIACRAYGYFRARSGGRFCLLVQEMVEEQGDEDLIWGNHETLDRRLERSHGPTLSLAEWLAER